MPSKKKGPRYAKWDYKKLPKLAAYIDRIGAEERSFRRYVIKREGRSHYHYDAVIIKIDGIEIVCSDPEFAPGPEEAAAIAVELKSEDFPKSITAAPRNLNSLKPKSGKDAMLFKFFDATGKRILFVQERIDPGTPYKKDLPWSFWDDGEWRLMEPDGDGLPLFGLQHLEFAPAVFLHEGAKTANAVQNIIWGPKPVTVARMLSALGTSTSGVAPGACPWIDDLKTGAHLGWPGGAPNPHRVDWQPIKALPPDIQVYIVCDNDMGGENAAPLISKRLQRPLKVIRFGKAFPDKFDLADPWPTEMWKERKGVLTYSGPSFDDCLGPATWATRMVAVPTEKKKDDKTKAKQEEKAVRPKLRIELRDEFISEWISCVKPPVFMQRDRLQARWVSGRIQRESWAVFGHRGCREAAAQEGVGSGGRSDL